MAAVLRFAKSSPLIFGVGFSGFKTSFSDLIVQKYVENREEIDWRRNAAFAAFGFGYLGVVQYSIYVPLFSRIFPRSVTFANKPLADKVRDWKGQLTLGAQVFLDQCVHHPFMYFPAFYCTKEALNAEPDFGRAYRLWRENFWGDLRALWQVWVPVTIANFAFSPMWMRIPVVASTSLLWTMILSSMRGAEKKAESNLARRQTVRQGGFDGKLDVVLEPGEEVDQGVILGPGVTARTMEIFARGLARRFSAAEASPGHEAAESEAETAHLCVVAHGDDRVGLVSLLSRWIYESGGNITGSKMLRMGDEFSIILHVTAADAAAAHRLRRELLTPHHRPEALGALSIAARELGRHAHYRPPQPDMREARLRLTGHDAPGIVFELTRLLSANGVNIDEMATDTVNAAATNPTTSGKDNKGSSSSSSEDTNAEPWFLLECYASFPSQVKLDTFNKGLDEIRTRLGVKIEMDWEDED